jgi:hypothetical protein
MKAQDFAILDSHVMAADLCVILFMTADFKEVAKTASAFQGFRADVLHVEKILRFSERPGLDDPVGGDFTYAGKEHEFITGDGVWLIFIPFWSLGWPAARARSSDSCLSA